MDPLQYLEASAVAVQAPNSIYFWPYMGACAVITFAALVAVNKLRPAAALRTMLDRRIWLTTSALTDLVVTSLYLLLFTRPTEACQLWIFDKVQGWLWSDVLQGTTLPFHWSPGPLVEMGLASVVSILCFDLATYVGHRLQHSVPWLWDIHAVHHSVEHLNFLSAYRQHPFDRLFRNAIGAVFSGIGLTLLAFVLPGARSVLTIMGVGAGFFLFMLTVHLQHSHVPVHYPRALRALVLSPHLHMIHHSADPRHHNKNFGGIFPYWDQLFGTYHDETLSIGSLTFGLGKDSDPIRHSILRCYLNPFLAPIGRLRQRLRPQPHPQPQPQPLSAPPPDTADSTDESSRVA